MELDLKGTASDSQLLYISVSDSKPFKDGLWYIRKKKKKSDHQNFLEHFDDQKILTMMLRRRRRGFFYRTRVKVSCKVPSYAVFVGPNT